MAMNRAEENVKMTARMYECRSAARSLLGDSYHEAITPYRDLIRKVMAAERKSVMSAAIAIGQTIPEASGGPLMFLFAAAVDLIERDNDEPSSSAPPFRGREAIESQRESQARIQRELKR